MDNKTSKDRSKSRSKYDKFRTGKRWVPPPPDDDVDLPFPIQTPQPVYSAHGTRPQNNVSQQEYERMDIVNRNPDELKKMEEQELPQEKTTNSLIQKFKQLGSDDKPSDVYRTGRRWVPPPPEDGLDLPFPTDVPAALQRPTLGVSRLPKDMHVTREVINRDQDPEEREEAERPPEQITQGLLQQFRKLETEAPSIPIPNYHATEKKHLAAAPRENPMMHIAEELRRPAKSNRLDMTDDNGEDSRPEVVRETDEAPTEQMPQAGVAARLLTQFKSVEDLSRPPPLPSMKVSESKAFRPAASYIPAQARSKTASRGSLADSGISDPEIVNESTVIEAKGGVFESEPEVRTDVIREDDYYDDLAELPDEGTSRSLIARFTEMHHQQLFEQEENTPPQPIEPTRWFVRPSGYLSGRASIRAVDWKHYKSTENITGELREPIQPTVEIEADKDLLMANTSTELITAHGAQTKVAAERRSDLKVESVRDIKVESKSRVGQDRKPDRLPSARVEPRPQQMQDTRLPHYTTDSQHPEKKQSKSSGKAKQSASRIAKHTPPKPVRKTESVSTVETARKQGTSEKPRKISRPCRPHQELEE